MAEIIVNTAPIGAFQTFQDTELDGVTYLVESAPSAGLIKRYAKSDHLYYTKDSTGTERAFVNVSSAQTLTNKTLTTPTIASFTNATHTHQDAAGGGTLSAAAIASGTLALARGGTNADLSATGGANQFLKQTSVGGAVTVAGITSGDLTTALTTPPAIGGVTPAAGTFTALAGTTGTFTNLVTVTRTTEQLRLAYDGSNYASFTVSSSGGLTIASTGASATTLTIGNGTNAQFSTDGRLALEGASFTDATSVIQTTGVALSVTGGAGTFVAHRMGPTWTVNTSNHTGTIIGTSFGATVNQNGLTVSTITGGNLGATASGATGTVTTQRGLVISNTNSGAGTVTTSASLFINVYTNSGGGTITNVAGLMMAAQTVGTNVTYALLGTTTVPSGNWAIHATTTNDSALAGKLKLGGVTAPGTTLDVLTSDAVTAAVTNVVTIGHDSSGTPAANYGTGASIQGKSSTTAGQSMGDIQWIWTTATHASRKARGTLTAYDTAVRTCIQWEASGTAPMIGFLGTAPVVQATAWTQTYTTSSHTTANPTATSVVTTGAALASYGYTQAQADDIVTELNRLITDVANAKNNINAIIDDIQAYGLFG